MSLPLIKPVLALVALTAIVYVKMIKDRVDEMTARKISPSKVSDVTQTRLLLKNLAASNNFVNLLEIPVFFFLFAAATWARPLAVDAVVDGGAWAFVLLRYMHSFVQISYGKVEIRFALHLISTGLVFALWVYAASAFLA